MGFPIKFEGVSSVGVFGLGILTICNFFNKTILGDFIRWVFWGYLTTPFNYILNHTPIIGSVCCMIILTKYTKHFWFLIVMGCLSFLFIQFILMKGLLMV